MLLLIDRVETYERNIRFFDGMLTGFSGPKAISKVCKGHKKVQHHLVLDFFDLARDLNHPMQPAGGRLLAGDWTTATH